LQGTQSVLYRLPAVLKAATVGGTIHICEGRRTPTRSCARARWLLTAPGGAGKWRASYSEALAGAHVVVVADQDEPGRKHAEAVAASVRAHAATVRVVLPAAGKDASDHLAAGLGLEDFLPYVEETTRTRARGGNVAAPQGGA
jgi:hypothetical protein